MSLIHWWQLCKGTYIDNGLKPSDIINSGAVFESGGILGLQYRCNGGSGYITKCCDEEYTSGQDFSIALWTKLLSRPSTNGNGMVSNNRYSSELTGSYYGGGFGVTILTDGRVRTFANSASAEGTITSSSVLSLNVWYHVVFTYHAGIHKIYINGVLDAWGNSNVNWTINHQLTRIGLGTQGGWTYSNNHAFNDVRIYDNCLSDKEVKELSKALILHYKLSNDYMEPTINYGYYPTKTADTYVPGWDATLHLNAILVANWTGGYNGGVTSPTTGYHAMWNMIDGIPTMVFQNHNSIISLRGRWLGISSSTLTCNITAGVKYTISYELRSVDTLGGYTTCGRYYKCTSSSGYNFYDGCPEIGRNTKLGVWERFSYTFTGYSSIDGTGNLGSIYVYGHNGTESTMQVRNFQLEMLDHATAYAPLSRDITAEYDVSGYNYNGTLTSTTYPSISTDTPRYSLSYNMKGNKYIKCENFSMSAMETCTVSFWIKPSSSSGGYLIIMCTYNNPTGNLWLAINCEGCSVWAYRYAYMKVAGSLSNNIWHHCVYTFDNGTPNWYIDGIKQTITTQTYTGTTIPIVQPTIGNSYTGSSWDTTQYGNISDFRIYATALSENDIKELYNTSASIDNLGNLYTREIIEK